MSEFRKYDHTPFAYPEEAKHLFAVLQIPGIMTTNFRERIKHHAKSTTLGFIDIVLSLPIKIKVGGESKTLRFPILMKDTAVGVNKKGGTPYISFKQEKSNKDGKYYDVCCTLSGASRDALTTAVFCLDEIKAAAVKALQLAEQGSGQPIVNAELEVPATAMADPFQDGIPV